MSYLYMLAKNPYQGDYTKALFVCSGGILRSATAAWWATINKDWNTRNAGTHDEALVPLSVDLLIWADKIYFMNPENFRAAEVAFDPIEEFLDKIKILNIPDNYEYRNPKLVALIEEALRDE